MIGARCDATEGEYEYKWEKGDVVVVCMRRGAWEGHACPLILHPAHLFLVMRVYYLPKLIVLLTLLPRLDCETCQSALVGY